MNATQVEAIRAFYERDRQQLYTYAVSITRNREAAEDAIHGLFEAILRSKALPADLRPYVFRAIRNAAFDSWRRAKVRTDSIFQAADEADGAESGPAGAFGTNDLEPFCSAFRRTNAKRSYSRFIAGSPSRKSPICARHRCQPWHLGIGGGSTDCGSC